MEPMDSLEPAASVAQVSWVPPSRPRASPRGSQRRSSSAFIPWDELTLHEPPLGAGSFGKVWMCTHAATEFAVKRLRPEVLKAGDGANSSFLGVAGSSTVGSSPALLDALIEEYQIMRELHHPNVLLVIGIATDRRSNTGIITELMQVLRHPQPNLPSSAQTQPIPRMIPLAEHAPTSLFLPHRV